MLDDRHELSFGCSGLAGLNAPVSAAAAQEVLQEAWDRGLRYFDTAPHYGNGQSERRIGDSLRSRSGGLLSTKVGRLLEPEPEPPAIANGFHSSLPFRQRFDYSYDGIMRSVEQSHHRLGLNRIDIIYVHDIGEAAVGTDDPIYLEQLLGSGAKALEELKSSGVVSAIGLGVNRVEICERLLGNIPLDLILLAGRYTLLDQTGARLFPLCEKHGARLVIGGVFNSGILATGSVEGAWYDYAPASEEIRLRVSRIEQICSAHKVELATAALQFPSRHKLVASTLIGTARTSSLRRNLEGWRKPVPGSLWDELEAEKLIAST